MIKFKVGDRVKCVQNTMATGGGKGDIVTITYIDNHMITFKTDYGEGYGGPDEWFELVEELPAPKFKIGDKVKVILPDSNKKLGEEFIIKKVYDAREINNPNTAGDVWYRDIVDECTGAKECNLELVIPTPIRDSFSATMGVPKLTNTIITDINYSRQHQRVQEKLFSMGNKWLETGKSIFTSDLDYIVVDDEGDMTIDRIDYPAHKNYKHITANDFLQEVDEIQPFHFDKPLPDKITAPSPYETLTYIQNQVDKMSKGQPPQPKQRWCGKSLADQYMADIIQYYKTSPTTKGDTNNKPMNNNSIVSFFNDLTVSAEDKELRKAGLKDDSLNWTEEAKDIVKELEAKELGYKNYQELKEKTDCNGLSPLEYHALFTKFYAKLLDTAKKYNRKDEKKTK